MRCPRCDAERFNLRTACRRCGFVGDPDLIEEFLHLDWALDEIDAWLAQDVDRLTDIRRAYRTRQREVEIALGLRPPPLTADAARDVWPQLYRQAQFLDLLQTWLDRGYVRPGAVRELRSQLEAYVATTQERLEHLVRFDFLLTDAVHLEVTTCLLERTQWLRTTGAFRGGRAYTAAIAPLEAQKATLEARLGLVPEPVPEEAPVPAEPEPAPEAAPAAPPPPPSRPQVPFRQRLLETLLSERTLHAILFLSIFLLFSAAITFVIWGWKDFSPWLRVAIPPGFTLVFFLMGWYLRSRTTLSQSGVAMAAIAALLIPIDFYTAYVNLDLMPGQWAEFWLLTSLVCLAAYLVVALRVLNPFFGYLVATAAGSAVLAAIEIGHQAGALSRDWYAAGLSTLSLVLMLLAAWLQGRSRQDRWRFYVPSLRTFALLAAGVLMPLTLGWRIIDRDTYDALHWSATVTWWLGGLLLGWGAVIYRSRALGLISAIAPPVAVYLTQAAIFPTVQVDAAWHAFGWAWLVPLYVAAGRWLVQQENEALRDHGRTFNWVALILLLVAAFWSLTDLKRGTAAAASHAVLAGSVILAAALWRRPIYLHAASLFSLSAATFGMTELSLTIAQLSVGWASLALLHVLVALALGRRLKANAARYAVPLVRAGYAIAGLAVLLTLFPYDADLAIYALGHWIALSGWGAYLVETKRPGFGPGRWLRARFHWLAALPLPFWIWMVLTHRHPADVSLALALAALAWGMVALSYRLKRSHPAYRWPWYLTGWLAGGAAVVVAIAVDGQGFGPALTLLAAGVLAFADAVTLRQPVELAPAGLATAAGLLVLLDRLHVSFDAATLGLSLLIALYVLAGLETERRRRPEFPHRFLVPLYLAAHALTLFVLGRIYARPLIDLVGGTAWTDTMKLWGAAAQLVLGVLYGLHAWGTYREGWAHVAAWLGTAAGGFLFIVYSRGRGSSALKAAVMVVVFVLAERALHWLRDARPLRRRARAFFRLAWRLYRRPFLVTGWILSAATIGLALVRNLWILGGGRTRQLWAVAGLLVITGLYALSVRLFRRPLFAWLAAVLIFAPWTILTDLGWLTAYRPTTPGFGASWAVLAWVLTLAGLLVRRRAPRPYARPLHVVAHLLMPFALLWGIADAETSRVTFGLAVAFYALAAGLDHRRLRADALSPSRASLWLYPALGLVPVWCVYLLTWVAPAARHEHHGLMLLAFGPLGLAAGEVLRRLVPGDHATPRRYGLPAYLTGYVALVVGTMLTAHLAGLLSLVLLFDALLMLVSAWLFREPLWDYAAAVLVPISLLIALGEVGVDPNRHGWWLLGLAAVYLALAWLLRRLRRPAHATSALVVGFALVALSLPPSSQDQVGALWGYGGAALLYAVTAFWLGQPLLLAAASGLALVPYVVAIDRSLLPPAYHGLALFPGAVAALGAGMILDRRFGAWRDFPWGAPVRWLPAVTERVLAWWALPLYAVGFGLVSAAPLFTAGRGDLSALNLVLLVPVFGWALHRFRRRGWLLALALAGHLALARYLGFLGWWRTPANAWLRFLPLTVATLLAALSIERWRDEGSPLALDRLFRGWSRPLYGLALLDVALAQLFCLNGTDAAALVTLVHALLLALLASVWGAPAFSYATAALGAAALGNELAFLDWPNRRLVVAFAQLALAYGVTGFGLALVRQRWRLPDWTQVWERPPQIAGLVLSSLVLTVTAGMGFDLTAWTVRALVGLPFRQIVDLATVRMVVSVLALLGLLYVAAAVVYRRLRLGYVAVGMLLASWMIYAFYVQEWSSAARVQWYAVPAGLYLLGISALEWRRGHKALGRWLDYAALLLMMGSLFWQTLLYGWSYALMLGAEGLATVWWGSARRLRRFLYGGMAGVILATLGQLIHSLQSVLQWILVSVVVGLALFLLGAFVERYLGRIRDSLQDALETWE